MSEETLPPGWATVEIQNLITPEGVFVDGDWVESKDQDPDGDVRLIQLADIGEGVFLDKSARFLTSASAAELRCTFLKKGDVLIARMPDPLGRACIFPLEGDDRFVTVVDVCIIRTSPDLASSEFLTSAINFLGTRKQIEDLQTGTTRKRISRGNLANVTIPLPPLPEQKRIVAKIEELFSELAAGEASLRKARRQLGVYRQSLLKQAFEGKLTQKWRTKNSSKLESPATLSETEGPHVLPAGWRWIKLGSAIEEPAYGTSKKCSYESSGLGVLRIPNVVKGAIEADDLKFAEFTEDERKSYELREGDLLLIRSNGSVSIVGRCAIIEPKHTGFLYAGYLIRLRPRAPVLNSRFLRDQMSSHSLRSQIEFSAKSTSGVNNINSKEIQRLLIALPPLPEQQEIVRLLDEQFEAIERNEQELDAALQRSEALRQSILKRAFSGRLVPQDPADEPASTLLARLRTERAATPARSRRS